MEESDLESKRSPKKSQDRPRSQRNSKSPDRSKIQPPKLYLGTAGEREESSSTSKSDLAKGEYFALRGSRTLKEPPAEDLLLNEAEVGEAYDPKEDVVTDLKDGLELDRLQLVIDQGKNTIDLQLAVLEAERLKYRKLMRYKLESQQDSGKMKWGRHCS